MDDLLTYKQLEELYYKQAVEALRGIRESGKLNPLIAISTMARTLNNLIWERDETTR